MHHTEVCQQLRIWYQAKSDTNDDEESIRVLISANEQKKIP
jgi:hypothetical protein